MTQNLDESEASKVDNQHHSYAGFVYLWYDRKRKWFCIGSHMGRLDDNYTSSTGWMKKAYWNLHMRSKKHARRIQCQIS